MSQTTTSINTKLIDSFAQIILSLSEEERQILARKIQQTQLSDHELKDRKKMLQDEINIAREQLKNGQYTEYDEVSLPSLLNTVRMRGKKQLEQELS